MKPISSFKLAILLGEMVVLGGLAFALWGMVPFTTNTSDVVEIYETFGQVQRFDSAEGEFVPAAVEDQITQGQQILTKGESWARLSFFDDGTSMHVDPFTSFSLLGTGEQNGVHYARLRLDVGRIFIMPLGSVVYVETGGGIIFADVPATVVNVWVDAETEQTLVFCLEGVCKINNRSGSVMLSEGQEAVLRDEMTAPVVVGLGENPITKGMVQELETGKYNLLDSVSERDFEPEKESAITAGIVPIECGPPQDWVIYSVVPGDNFEALLATFSVGANDFQKANCLGESRVIIAGLSLFVPPLSEEPVSLAVVPAILGQQSTAQVYPTQKPAKEVQPTPNPMIQVQPPEEAEIVEMRDIPIVRNGDYVSNPGMGWQYQGGTFPITYPAETVAYSRRAQISWRVLNPSEGVYDWSALDAQLQLAVSQGKQYSFRVYTMIGEDYGGHQVPQWVLNKGAELLSSGEPNYSNCTYQAEWGKFVNKLIQRYDGNPNIAFIDISGYGNFNEWSWQDTQTLWDDVWADHYASGTASRDTLSNLDSFARRVLADMFIGGSYQNHQCAQKDGSVNKVNYAYPGFTKTQLLMPYAGIIQSSQYVFSQRKDVGFRHDCLGRTSSNKIVSPDRFGAELAKIWPKAPVVFETCKPGEFSMENASYLVESAHVSLVHDVNLDMDTAGIMNLIDPLGYQYVLKSFRYSFKVPPDGKLTASLEWQNFGLAPSYPKMGQRLELHVYFYDSAGNQVVDYLVPENLSTWLPAAKYGDVPPVYSINISIDVSDEIPPGIYYADSKIIDVRTGNPIWIPFTIDSKLGARN